MRANGLVNPDPEEGKDLDETADDEAPFATELLNGNRHKETGGDHLDDSVDASGKQTTRLTVDAERLEDLRTVVVDTVGTYGKVEARIRQNEARCQWTLLAKDRINEQRRPDSRACESLDNGMLCTSAKTYL